MRKQVLAPRPIAGFPSSAENGPSPTASFLESSGRNGANAIVVATGQRGHDDRDH
jgi:hypothetical protein